MDIDGGAKPFGKRIKDDSIIEDMAILIVNEAQLSNCQHRLRTSSLICDACDER